MLKEWQHVLYYSWVCEAVFGFKEAGLKLDVTTWSRGSRNQSQVYNYNMQNSCILEMYEDKRKPVYTVQVVIPILKIISWGW